MPSFPQITTPKKGPIKIKRHHGYTVLLFILGTVFPPLAVAARFGIGTDFFINLLLTVCGYIPGHAHNFYIQNVRNNKNNRRTPKWAIRYGLIDDSFVKKKKKKSQWANRYEERLPNSTYEGREVEEGQEADVVAPDNASVNENGVPQRPLWRDDEESFYSTGSGGGGGESTGRWHYPANFDESEVVPDVGRKKKKSASGSKKAKASKVRDRWERTEEAYAAPAPQKKKRSSAAARRRSEDSMEGPEDPLGVGYWSGRGGGDGYGRQTGNGNGNADGGEEDSLFTHQF